MTEYSTLDQLMTDVADIKACLADLALLSKNNVGGASDVFNSSLESVVESARFEELTMVVRGLRASVDDLLTSIEIEHQDTTSHILGFHKRLGELSDSVFSLQESFRAMSVKLSAAMGLVNGSRETAGVGQAVCALNAAGTQDAGFQSQSVNCKD